jgi:GMP synthase (glutamine-hydrolysing)
MAKKLRNEISILLVQPRSDLPMVDHEIKCISQYSGLSREQLISVSPFYTPINNSLLENVDGVIIGGSDTSVLDNFPWTNSIIELIHKIAEVKMPLFGSCWGHQMVAKVFGGEVVSDLARKEMGSIEVSLTEQGKEDLIFGKLPIKFTAQSGHKDHVCELPNNIEPLAYSGLSPYQAIKVKDCPIYGAQFHADMDKLELKERLEYYQYDYVNTEEFSNICNSLQQSPEAVKILSAFVDDVVLAQ